MISQLNNSVVTAPAKFNFGKGINVMKNQHQLTVGYKESFKTFLRSTNEKQEFARILTQQIRERNVDSLLDIGAGNGDLALPLSQSVKRYLAVEPNTGHASALRHIGLAVIEQPFPCLVDGKFSMIIASHVVSGKKDLAHTFLQAAWELLNQKGILAVVTYERLKGDWSRLIEEAELPLISADWDRSTTCKEVVSAFDRMEVMEVETLVRTTTLGEMVAALSFVYSDGKPEAAEQFQSNGTIQHVLESHYCNSSGYTFPFQHYLLMVQKQ